MERSLNAIVDVLVICLNFMVILGLEIVANVSFGEGRAPLYALLLPLVLPLLFYAFRKWVKNLALFLIVHGAAVFALLYPTKFFPVPMLWKIVFGVVSVIYTAGSFRIRLTWEDDGEGELTEGFMGAAAVGLFFLCSYLKSEEGCAQILWLSLLWLPGHWLAAYLRNFLGYMELNRQSAGAMPEKKILRGGLAAVGIYGGVSMVLLAVCTKTSLVAWLSEQVRRVGIALIKLLFMFLSLFSSEPEEIAPAAPEVVPDEPMMYLPAAEEAPLWMQLLDKAFTTAMALALLAGAVMLIVWLIRCLIRSFYGRERVKKEVRQEGFVEEEERLNEKKGAIKERIPVIGGTPAQRVRRIFRRTVKAFAKGKEDAGLSAKTARELAAWCADAELVSPVRTNEWDALTELYERARYTEREVTKEDVREAGRLSYRILH